MECVLRGNQIRNLNRAISCLARIGNELIIDARPNKVTLQTLNSSRSAFVEVTFKEQFFDDYRLTVPLAQCGVLLKAFQGFCEGFDADMHFFFEKAGSPILLAPRFGLDDSAHADFDAMLVLATMLESQLKDREIRETRPVSHDNGMPSATVHGNLFSSVGSGEQSAHTRIWSDMSGSAATRSLHDRGGPVWGQDSADASEEIPINIQKKQVPVGNTVNNETANMADYLQSGASGSAFRHLNSDVPAQGEGGIPCRPTEVGISMHNLSNWISEDTEEEEEDGGDDVCVQSTPPRRKGLPG